VLWAVGLAAAVAVGTGVRYELEARRQREGRAAVARAAQLTTDARRAEAAGDLEGAVEDSRKALEILRATEGARDSVPYAAALVDLASRLARQGSADAVASAASLLDEAWALVGLPPALQGRIARDRGAVELLRGDLVAAQRWYEDAQRAVDEPNPRLEALRESGASQETRGR
jgi:hypothetical protein